jgi:membrane protein implicated in regulation of membrane protease activity
MANSADALRRWFGVLFLILAAGMLIWGQTLLAPVLERNPLLFVFYWFGCFAFTMLAVFMALLDVRATRRRTRAEQNELIQRTLQEIEAEKREREAASQTPRVSPRK